MKRCLFLVLSIVVLSSSVFGRAAFFLNTLVEFKTGGGEPEMREGHKYYQQDVYWTWSDGDTPFSLKDLGQETDFNWSVDVTGDITIPNGYYDTKNGSHYELNRGSHIFFDGTSGTITVTALQPDFEGIPYSCSYTILYHMGFNSKKWDFYSNRLAIGQYKDNNSRLHTETASGNWEKISMGGNNSPQVYAWKRCDIYSNSEADWGQGRHIIEEANGLKINAQAWQVGIWNENDTLTECSDRFLALKKGASFTISKEYYSSFAHPRIRIKMGRYGGPSNSQNEIDLTVTNGKDAIGNTISGTGTYVIGGSIWWGVDKGRDNHQRGEYQFQVADKNQDFTVKVEDGQWLMLYTIEVYDSDEIITENAVLGDTYQLLNNEGAASGAAGTYYLHYRGKGEQTRIGENTVTTTGTVTCNKSSFTNNSGGLNHRYTSNVGEFGSFRMRMECYTHRGNYCTDYAWRTQSVGYMQKHAYPYTWDFTDAKTYITSDDNRMGKESVYAQNQVETGSLAQDYAAMSRNLWQTESDGSYGLRVAVDGGTNVLFCGGSQLWCGKQIIPELQYLAFTPVNYDYSYNGALSMQSDGLHFDQSIRDWWLWRITVPSVPTNGTIYVRAHKLRDDSFYNVGYYYGNATNKTDKLRFDTSASAVSKGREIAVTNDGSGDVIYAIPAPSTETNVTLFFTGVIVRKISVATDEKKVNIKGYASESRNHDIDAKLLPYFTGEDFKTYIVSNPDYDKLTLTLTDVGSSDANYVMKAYTGCVIRRVGEGDDLTFNVFNNGKGFHLFVPDMHDTTDGTNNKYVAAADQAVNDRFMIPVLSEMQVPYTNTGNYVTLNHDGYDGDGAVWYAFTWSNDQDGTWIPEADGMFTGLKSMVIFVRMNPNGMVSWSSKWNQTEDLTPQNGKTFTITGWDNGNGKLAGSWSDAGQATDMTNYVLTYNYKKLNGTNLSATISGEEKFYRVYSGWDIWLRANSAYLQLPTASVLSDGAPRAARMFSFFFADANNEQETTAIDALEGMAAGATPVDVTDNNAVWYNIYGQRLGSRPTQRGVYIVNGKKVTVK